LADVFGRRNSGRVARMFLAASLLVGSLASGSLLTGCASTEPENASSRPWNAPTRGGSGFPGIVTDQRR
jgi:hypothetical protein